MKLSNFDYLTNVLSKSREVWAKLSPVEGSFEHIEIGATDADEIFKFMIELSEYNKLPEIVSDKKFHNIKSVNLFRGTKMFKYHENLLTGKNYHYGRGYTNGIFASILNSKAKDFTCLPNVDYTQNKHQPEKIVKIKLNNAKTIEYSTLSFIVEQIKHDTFQYLENETKNKMTDFVNFCCSLNDDEMLPFINIFLRDLSKFAIYLGYDAIKDKNDFIILNRRKIAVSKSELDRILDGAQNEEKIKI